MIARRYFSSVEPSTERHLRDSKHGTIVRVALRPDRPFLAERGLVWTRPRTALTLHRLFERESERALHERLVTDVARDRASDLLDDLPFSPTSIETIRARLTKMRDAAEAKCFTKNMQGRLSRYLDYVTLSLERWPLKAIDFDIVTDGLTSTYRRAQQLVPDSWPDAEPEHLHDLRRRVVEHRHQMDLVEPLWPRLGKVWAEEAQRLRNRLGSCQDLAVLTELTAPHQLLAPWRSRLAPLIAARRGVHLKTAQRVAGRLFAEKPKAFRQRIAALWSARQ